MKSHRKSLHASDRRAGRRIASVAVPPLALISLSLVAAPEVLTVFNFSAALENGANTTIALTFDAGQSGATIGGSEQFSITRATLNLDGVDFETDCPEGAITATQSVITGTLALCGPIIQTNGDDPEFAPDIWSWTSPLVQVPGLITDTIPPDLGLITVTIDVRDPSLALIQPGVIISNTDALFANGLAPSLYVDFGNGNIQMGTNISATTTFIGQDSDGDGYPDAIDNCPDDPNPDQTDTDGDQTGDACDDDDDNDGQTDAAELACGSDPLDPNSLSADFDGDGEPDCLDADDDNDSVADAAPDVCPGTLIPESVPTSSRGLLRNRWTLENSDGHFTQAPPQAGRLFDFTIADTRGCSCEQIVGDFPRRRGLERYGCTTGILVEWVHKDSPPGGRP